MKPRLQTVTKPVDKNLANPPKSLPCGIPLANVEHIALKFAIRFVLELLKVLEKKQALFNSKTVNEMC